MHTKDMKAALCEADMDSGSVLDMILATARKMPNSPAVVCGEHRLSYDQLLRVARLNAERLIEAGARRGDFVLCGLSTGADLPIAWLATMISGTVLVPVDLQWPASRLNSVAQITRAPITIVPAETLAQQSSDAGRASCLAMTLTGAADGDVEIAAALTGSDLIYGFFTSGSTGTPKCALNHHAGLMNRFAYMTKRFGGEHRVYQNSAPLFDSSIWQLLWPLTSGGVSVLPEKRDRWSLDAVVDVIEQYRITMTDFVPTLFKAMVRAMEQGLIAPSKLETLRYVLIGGEAIDPISVHTFRRLLPEVRIINTYGHTEASIGMVFHEVRDEDGDRIPLGAPIDDTFIRIVDDNLRELPHGAFGELLVAGICVGAGYLNAPDLTAKAFVPNPFPDLPGTIAYRSGDLGRFREDGLLEFAGRIDDQVKVRGVRIELTELSIAAREVFPAIEDVCAVVVASPMGEQSLAMAYTAREPIELPLLRRRLSSVLPASHLPQFFMHLPCMPVGANGKTDRKEVVRQIVERLEPTVLETGEPQTPLQLIVQSYCEALGARDIDEQTHFFDYGGDSLGAVHLSLALQNLLGYHVPAGMVYRYPTPARLHAALMGADETPARSLRPPAVEFANTTPPQPWSRRVLLTGATGFVGVHVLGRLLAETELEIVVLVRDKKGHPAAERLDAAFRVAFPGRSLPRERLQLMRGDLSLPTLGLTAEQWSWLADDVDEIVHCGADVNFLGGAASLFDANVAGTAELVRLCGEGQGKRLHQISTLAVKRVESTGLDDVEHDAETTGGYEYTKYLADQLVQRAQRQGLQARIYRLDDVLPALGSGHPNARSLIHLFLKICLRYEMAVTHSGSVGLLPVDVFAEWICSFVGGAERFSTLPDRLNVTAIRQVEFDDLVRFVADGIGRRLDTVDYSEFLARLSSDRDHEAMLLRSMLPGAGERQYVFCGTGQGAVERSALSAPPWRARFSLELADFSPFVRYMERTMDAELEAQI